MQDILMAASTIGLLAEFNPNTDKTWNACNFEEMKSE